MRPRREQTVVSVRSDKLAARLKLLTRGGRSQAEILEEAIDHVPDEKNEIAERIARIEALSKRIAEKPARFRSMAEFDAWAYDERGMPR